MQVSKTTFTQEIKDFFEEDSLLQKHSLPDTGYKHFEYTQWLTFKVGSEIVGVVALQDFTNTVVVFHPYVSSKYWGTGTSDRCYDELEKHLEDSHYVKIMTTIPHVCHNCVDSALRKGFTVEGHIKAGAMWRGQLRDLIIMTKFIRRAQ